MKLHPKTQDAYRLLHDGTLALARAERQGLRVDILHLTKTIEEVTEKVNRLEKQLYSTNFYKHWKHSTGGKSPNIYSNAQLATFLYRTKKIKPVKTTITGQGATDEEALTALQIPELNDLLQIRKLKKIRDTYLEGFLREQVNGYLHPSFNLHLVRTFRSSSDRPNFQNIPKRDKEAMQLTRSSLYPRPGHQLVEIDYSGLEVKIAAAYHRDSTMLKYIHDPTTDMHSDMAAQIFMIDDFDKKIPEHSYLRAAAKNGFVFPQFYGDYYKNCAEGLAGKWGELPNGKWKPGQGIKMPEGTLSDHLISKGLSTLDRFTEHIKEIEYDFWNNRFSEYAEWKQRWWKAYQRNGYIELLTGFRCSGVMSRNDAINYPVQGAAFHCLLWSFIQIDRRMLHQNWDTKIIGQIHDAIVLDVHPDELEMVIEVVEQITCRDLPEAWKWINVPLEVDVDIYPVDKSWADKIK
jgi:DNA polymerase I